MSAGTELFGAANSASTDINEISCQNRAGKTKILEKTFGGSAGKVHEAQNSRRTDFCSVASTDILENRAPTG
jgi:hypothetical protein